MMDNRFDIYEVPEGHAERFNDRLNRHIDRRLYFGRIVGWTTTAAAAVALFLFTSSHPFFGARTPEAVYSAYLEEVGDLYRLFAAATNDGTGQWETMLQALTDENIPMYEQLPEELTDREKTLILKQYYGKILEGADRLRTQMKKQ